MASPVQCIVEGTLLLASATLLYTAPANTWVQIIKCTYVNTDGSSRSVTSWVGSGASTGTIITDAQALLAHQSFNSPNEYAHVLNPGDGLFALADVAGVVSARVSALLAT